MKFQLEEAIGILSRTPDVLRGLLAGFDDHWLRQNEGGESFSPYDVLGHLLHGEMTDWIPRARIILEQGETRPFNAFDRHGHRNLIREKTMDDLLRQFEALRKENLDNLRGFHLQEKDLDRTGKHPALGQVTLGQLLATWVVHDFEHIAQICRVLGKQYRGEVGPWVEYLPMIQGNQG